MGWIIWFILFFALTTLSHQTTNYRLPNISIPNHYILRIEPHIIPGNFTFNGEVEISLTIIEPSYYITLHCDDLRINQDHTLLFDEKTYLSPKQHVFQKCRQFLILHFEDLVQRGNYTLYLKYSSNLDVKNTGFFRTSYFNENNKIQSLVATVFEPTFARRAFPCWDEPAYKATFDIWIKHFPKHTALSNMPVTEVIDGTTIDGKLWTIFETTPPMSTYLVAFAVSDFKDITNRQGNVSVWARNNRLESVKIALKCSLKAISSLEKYTGTPYALPKLDIIVIPEYTINAVANWGLIVIGEADILRYSSSLLSDKMKTALIVVHKLSQQWFGNLVSPEWWSDLWITEGIATYLQYFMTAEILKDPKMKGLLIVDNNYPQLDAEDIEIARSPLASVKDDPESLIDHLHSIRRKAAGVIYMISCLMPRFSFQTVLRNLLKTHRLKSISAKTFFASMQEALDKEKLPQYNFDLKLAMNPYLYQTGYLVINVTRNYRTGQITVKQSCTYCKSNQSQKFWVPINFSTSRYPFFFTSVEYYWMYPFEDEMNINVPVHLIDWTIFNVHCSGFYRLFYDEENWRRIISYLNSAQYFKIHVLNRAGLLEDALWATKYHGLNSNILKNLTSYLLQEKEYIPWVSGLKVLKFLRLYYDRSMSIRDFFDQFLNDLPKALSVDVETDHCSNTFGTCALQRIIELVETNLNPLRNNTFFKSRP